MTPTSSTSPSAAGSPPSLCLLCGASNPPSATSCQTCGSPLAPAAPAFADEGDLSGFARALPAHTSLRNGDYRILGVLGQGGFGITYRASNQRLEREVAIKEFFPATCERVGRSVSASGGLSTSDFDSLRAAFMEEARILARFELPAVVRVMGAWEENESAYMEMEILRGPTMAQVLEERERLPVESTLRLFEPVIDALETIHAAGWLHRDIKPHNIIFEPNVASASSADPKNLDLSGCRAVLLDFGAAKKVAANVSQSFSVIVTPGYAPLEQYATRARRGAFTDVYALCATLYHALTGQIPPSASDRALHDDLIPVRELRPEVPQVIARAIEEGLQTSIARRPQTMAELRELLRGRGAFQTAVQAASEVRESRDPKVGQLKARQQSILSNIQSINDPKSEQARREKLISSLPVSNEAMQMLQSAAQSPANSQSPSPPVSVSKHADKPLPSARPTYGGASGSGGHLHEGLSERGTGNRRAYFAAIGFGLMVLFGARTLFAPSPPPPIEPPPIEEPMAIRAQSAVANMQLSPDGRYEFGITSDGHGHVGAVSSKQHVLDVGFLPAERLHAVRWSPDSKYLLITQCALRTSEQGALVRQRANDLRSRWLQMAQHHDTSSTIIAHDVRLFRTASPALIWRRNIMGTMPEQLPEWNLGHSVGLRVEGQMRRFPLE